MTDSLRGTMSPERAARISAAIDAAMRPADRAASKRGPDKRRLETAVRTLGMVSELNSPLIDERMRDEISHVIFLLDQLMERS